jgi:hypothetical protein
MDNNNEMPDKDKENQLLSDAKIKNNIEEKENDNKLLIEHVYRKRDNTNDNKNNENDKNNNDIKNDNDNNKINNDKTSNDNNNVINNKENNKDKNEEIKPNKESDKDKINQALISQKSPNKIDENKIIPEKEKENNTLNNSPINKTDINDNKTEKEEPTSSLSKKVEKKVSFDDNVVYINYDEDEYVTDLQLTDINGKVLPYKVKDISKYLRLLTSISHTSKLKPAIIDLNKKKKNVKKTKIMQRNMDYIKEVEKSGNVYNIMSSRETQPKKKYVIENMKGCRKFLENPQQFFTEDLCDAVILSLNLVPKETSRSSSENRKKSKEKK